ncbi:MAG: hypothetical protein ACLGQH_06680 [Acidobacteriota bacterium]
MRGRIVCIALAVCVLMAGTAMARQLDGFSGTAFGTPLAALPSFLTLKKDGNATYAVNLNEGYRLDGRAPVVIYGFATGKLFAAYVRLDGVIDRNAMVQRLTAEYGKPSTAMDDGVEVLRWRKGKVKVKLKFNAATGSLKLGAYSTTTPGPAANMLEMDNVDVDALVKLYEKDKIAKGVAAPAASAPEKPSPFAGSPVVKPNNHVQ